METENLPTGYRVEYPDYRLGECFDRLKLTVPKLDPSDILGLSDEVATFEVRPDHGPEDRMAASNWLESRGCSAVDAENVIKRALRLRETVRWMIERAPKSDKGGAIVPKDVISPVLAREWTDGREILAKILD